MVTRSLFTKPQKGDPMTEMTAKSFFEDKLVATLKQKGDKLSAINSKFEFQISGSQGGTWTLDLTTPGGKVLTGSQANPSVTIRMSDENFVKLVTGNLNPQMAFMTGKIKVSGKMGLALKLQSILG